MIAQDLLPREWTHQHNCHVLEWRLEQRQFKWEQNMQAGRRLREAVNWLAQRCRDGQLVSYARFRTGGHLWPMAAWEWNVDDPLPKFVIEGGHKRYFSELKGTGPFEVYLFFTRAELVAAFNRLKLAPVIVPAADLSRLSPFLQLAVLLARKNEYYSKAQCETQAVREAEVRAVWSVALPDVPATENSVQLVARIMGFPDPVAIKRGQKARRSGKRVEG